MQSVASRLGGGLLLAVLAFGTAQAAPASGGAPAAGASSASAGAASQGAGGASHRPIGGQAASDWGRASRAISENDCLNQGGKVSRVQGSCGGGKQCETVSKDGKTVTVECITAD